MGDWCVLRTAGSNTLRLADSLAEAGFEVWTPTVIDQRINKRTEKPEAVIIPLIASFVFASYDRLVDLIELSRSPSMLYQVWDSELRKMVTKGHPYFSVLRSDRRYRPVPECQLAHMRSVERRRKPRGKPKEFVTGDKVRLIDGGFAGMRGKVESVKGKFAHVTFPGYSMPAEISVWLLHLDEPGTIKVSGDEPEPFEFRSAA